MKKNVFMALAVGLVGVAWGGVDSTSYLQQGLVAQWDGIENSMRGKHEANLSGWTDLSGNKHNLESFVPNMTWTDNALVFPANAYSIAARFISTTALGAGDYAAFDLSYEETSKSNKAPCLFGFGNFKGLVLYHNGDNPSASSSFFQFNNGQGWAGVSTLNQPHHAYVGYGTTSSTVADEFTFDGVGITERRGNDTWYQGTSGLGYANNANWAFHGKLYALRLYNRPLTQVEQKLNFAIDQVRFHGKTAANVGLPDGYTWTGDGNISFNAFKVEATGGGLVKADGGTAAVSLSLDGVLNQQFKLQAQPVAGKAFRRWTGDTAAIISGSATTASITVRTITKVNLVAEFADETSFAAPIAIDGANLVHRWSFSGDLVDSIGGLVGTSAGGTWDDADHPTSLTLKGGARGSSYICLGVDTTPRDTTAFTYEFWVRQNAVQNWSRMFDMGNDNTSSYFIWAFTSGTNLGTDVFEVKNGNTQILRADAQTGAFTLGQELHCSVVVTQNQDGTATIRYAKRDVFTGKTIKVAERTTTAPWSISKLSDWKFYLGRSQFNDSDASATYNEVRVWKCALTDEQLDRSARLGPDQLPTTEQSDRTVQISVAAEFRSTEAGATSIGAVRVNDGVAIAATNLEASVSSVARFTAVPGAGNLFLRWETDDSDLILAGSVTDPEIVVETVRATSFKAVYVKATEPFTATWTGAVDNDVAKSGNWQCYDAAGNLIADVVPSDLTAITLKGNVGFSCSAPGAIHYASLSVGDVTITDDCDWSGLVGKFTIDGVLNLNGHRLTLPQLKGSGTVTSPFTTDTSVAVPSAVSTKSCLWLDAADPLTIDADANGNVSSWTSKGTKEITASAGLQPVYSTATYGRPTIDFGVTGSRKDMLYPRFTNLRTLFWVMRIEQTGDAFLLGDCNNGSGAYNFHRGTSGQYGASAAWDAFADVRNGTVSVGNGYNAIVDPSRFHVISITTTANRCSDSLTNDRNLNGGQRTGGRQLSELICFDYDMGEAERTEIIAYLQQKWMANTTPAGELVVDLPEGQEMVNDTVRLEGNFKLVKKGLGKFTATKSTQYYSGGTEVAEGTFVAGTPGVNSPFGSRYTTFTVQPGATFDVKGYYDNYYYDFLLGGNIVNTGADVGGNTAQLGNVKLTGDVRISYADLINTGYTALVLDLDQHRLTLEGNPFYLDNAAVNNGWVVMSEGELVVDKTSLRAATANFDVGGPLTLNTNGDVNDLIIRTPVDNLVSGAGVLTIHGTYTPYTDYLQNFRLADGATIDLSQRTSALVAYNVYGRQLSFADGATITVKLSPSERSLTLGERLIAWNAAPQEGVSFQLDSITAGAATAQLVAAEDGLYYGTDNSVVSVARWTGAAGNGLIDDPANWCCSNAWGSAVVDGLPSQNTTVYIEGESISLQIPKNSDFVCASFAVGSGSLSGNCDWTGLAVTPSINGSIDLKGHNLRLAKFNGAGKIFDSTGYDYLDYIESTGSQRIATGITPGSNTAVRIEFTTLAYKNDSTIFGVNSWNGNRYLFIEQSNSLRFYGSGTIMTSFAANTRYAFETSTNGVATIYNASNTVIAQNNVELLNSDNAQLYLFALSGGGYTGVYRLHAFKMWQNGVLVRDFIPVRQRATGLLGLLDRTDYKFYSDAATMTTTTPFVAGGVLSSDEALGGELQFEVPEGASITNTTVTLGGNLSVVKEGAGEFVAGKNGQYFRGGVVVNGGRYSTLTSGSSGLTYAGFNYSLAGQFSVLTLNAGGVLDFKGNYDCRQFLVKMNGGTLANDGCDMTQLGNGSGFYMDLEADSWLDCPYTTAYWGPIQNGCIGLGYYLNGHTLTANVAPGKQLRLDYAHFFTNGTLRVTGGGSLHVRSNPSFNPTSTLECDGASLQLDIQLTVSNYVHRSVGAVAHSGSSVLAVTHAFCPYGDDFYNCTLQNGATLDLSMRTTPLPLASTVAQPRSTITFADGGTNTVELGEREIAVGDKLIDWSAVPANVKFVSDAGELDPRADGLYFGPSTVVIEADWTGSAGDGDIANPLNWSCRNANGAVLADKLPMNTTLVRIEGNVNAQFPVGASLQYCEVRFGNVTLTQDCDWRGLTAPINGTINLNGHKLYLSKFEGTGTITSPFNGAAVTPPAIVSSSSSFWLDASARNTLSVDANNKVTFWNSRDLQGKVASATSAPTYNEFGYGRPTVDFGGIGSNLDMSYTQQRIRTAFWVIKIAKSECAFLLGDTSNYNFHRGAAGQYGNTGHAKFATIWNGTSAVNIGNDYIPDTGFQVISATMNVDALSNRLTTDRNCKSGSTTRTGGRQLSELILFTTTLNDAQRTEITEYLQKKWMNLSERTTAEVHLEVPEGRTLGNSGITINGLVRFVKDGPGIFAPTKTGQSYAGGTEIAEGMMRAWTQHYPNGTTDDIVIREGATLDIDGLSQTGGRVASWTARHVLDGGTVANLGSDLTEGWTMLGNVKLTKNARIGAPYNFGFVGGSYVQTSLDLNGHTLDVDLGVDKYFYLYNLDAYNGTFRVQEPTGRLVVNKTSLRAGTVDFDLSCNFEAYAPSTMRSFICRSNKEWAYGECTNTVTTMFRPEGQAFPNVLLKSGATLDVTAKGNGTWSTASVTAGRQCLFEEGGSYTLAFGDRRGSTSDLVVDWSDNQPTFWSTLSFQPAAAQRSSGYRLVVREDGVHVLCGLAIYLR